MKRNLRFPLWLPWLIIMCLSFGYIMPTLQAGRMVPGWVQPVLIVCSLSVPVVLVAGLVVRSVRKSALRKVGIPATAMLIKAEETGTQINNRPEMILTVQIRDETGSSWKTTIREVIPLHRLYTLQPGTTMDVVYDPADKQTAILANQ